ncbi:MAG: hypothetical protein APF81_09405 [Desulfosporosinus sp. BRH_c37]|nr:MAG: hypothetical protein APF81_09405 [Desulfosporosinus sp. BRH_c37]
MRDLSRRLMGQFFRLYLGVTLFGVSIITLDNVYIEGSTIQELRQYNFGALFAQAISGVSIFQIFTFLRLRIVRRYFQQIQEHAVVSAVWQRLSRFPSEVFWAMLIFGFIASLLYHILEAVMTGASLRANLRELAQAVLFEQTLSLILAILFYTLIRQLLRPYILALPSERMWEFPRTTFLTYLTISFTSLMLITILSPSLYVLRMISSELPVNPWVMFSVAGSTLAFGLFLFLLLAWQFQDELRLLIQGLLSLLEGDGVWLNRRMPIISQDEVGQLGVAFNQLQDHISQDYLVVQREMQLAYQVQQKLLPPSSDQIGEYQIAAICQPTKEVGGDLYDIVRLKEDQFAVIAGDVSGHGMPAALVMSAVLVLFRTEVHRGGSASEVLRRLNHAVVETLQGDMFVTLGIGIFDQCKSTLEYASAGHVAPYLLRGGQVTPILCSSLPLGINKDEAYLQVLIPIHPADRFVLYTDGVIEAMNENGEMLGFPGFERYLSDLNSTASVQDQIDSLVKELPWGRGNHKDDRTIIMVEHQQAEVLPESKRDAG